MGAFYFCGMRLKEYFPQQERQARKGRSEVLIEQRDEVLSLRFYLYAHIKGENYENTISNLSREFFIAERVVMDRLRMNQQLLDELFATKPIVAELKKKAPFFSWG